jgi:hypothetical protein
VSVSGRVLRGGRDTVPLPNATVVLHRMARSGAGPIDSVRSDARGRYRIALRNPDSTSGYIVSVWFDSIAYFSLPLNVVGRPAVHVEDIVTFATTVGSPPITLTRRLATIGSASHEGTREVLEILELENRGQTTRVTADTFAPTWAGRLPDHTGQYRAGEGDVSPEAMRFRNDSVLIYAPLPPGTGKQISYDYSIAAGTHPFVIPVDQPTVEVNLLVEDTAAVVSAPKLESFGRKEIEGRHFAAYRAGPLVSGDRVEIWLPAGRFRVEMLLRYVPWVVGVSMLGVLLWALLRKPASPRLS